MENRKDLMRGREMIAESDWTTHYYDDSELKIIDIGDLDANSISMS